MLSPGDKVDGYEILRTVGAGAMGCVYEAQQASPERRVAIKVLHEHLAQDANLVQRFDREINAMATVQHENVVPIYVGDVSVEGLHYFIMRLVAGRSLEDLLRNSLLGRDAMLAALVGAAAGLDACHDRRVLHRDVKPSNILVEHVTGRGLLADFGMARADDAAALTEPGHAVGTMAYMAPEVLRGEAASPASDIFSFACVLYRVLTGRSARPTRAAPDPEGAISPPSARCDGLGPAVDRVMMAALARRPADRPRTASLFVAGLRDALDSAPRTATLSTRVMPKAGQTPRVEEPATTLVQPRCRDDAPTARVRLRASGRRVALVATGVFLATPIVLYLIHSIGP